MPPEPIRYLGSERRDVHKSTDACSFVPASSVMEIDCGRRDARQTLVRILPIVACLALFGAVRADTAETDAVRTIAHILFGLTHRVTSVETSTLNMLVADSTTSSQVRAIAQALANVQHTARDGDRDKLQALINDASVSASLKTLATIIHRVRHVPTPTDKAELQKLLE
jgi:prephenate dehydrogenase